MALATYFGYDTAMNDVARTDFAPQTPARFSIEEFQRMVDSDVFNGMARVELVEGVIVRMSPAQPPHMVFKRRIFLDLHDIYRNSVWIVHSELTLKFGSATLRDADVGVIRPFGLERVYPDPANVLLCVEVSDTSLSEDLGPKLHDYARAGIPHYWVVDLNGNRTHVMATPLEGSYADRHPVTFGDPIPVPDTDRTIVIG